MKLLFFSDSHGYNVGMAQAIDREAPDAVVHLGDYVSDAQEMMELFPLLPIYSVRGNNDYERDVVLHAAITPDNVPIYITHGHREGVWHSINGVVRAAIEEGCKLAFYGHTHHMMIEKMNGVLVCNPGSISMPRGGEPSYARLTVMDSEARLLELLNEDGGLLLKENIKE